MSARLVRGGGEVSAHDMCRCGVYRYVHEPDWNGPSHIPCKRFRKAGPLAAYRLDHSIRRHVAAWLWLKVPEMTRWSVVNRIHAAMPDLCWCDLVDAAMAERGRAGCLCEVDLPVARRLTAEDYGKCYCPSPADRAFVRNVERTLRGTP